MTRISPGTVIVGIFAILFGLVGAYAVRNSLSRAPAVPPAPPALNTVPIASLDLEPGRRITMGDIAIMRLTGEQLLEQGIPDGYMINPQQIIGRTLKDDLTKGKPFFTDQLYPEGVGPTISDRLKPGFRAVTVEIANVAAVAGLAPPGSFVDVYFRTTAAKTPDLPETTITLLENVEVLALGPNLTPGMPSATAQMFAGNVTVAVTPEQASALKVVEGRGELMLALRSPDDAELPTEIRPETLEGLLGVVVQPGVPPTQTTIYRGVSNQTVSFAREQTASPIRITARPIRGRSGGASNEPAPLPPESPLDSTTEEATDTEEATEVPAEATSPTSSLDPDRATQVAQNPQVLVFPPRETNVPQATFPTASTTNLPARGTRATTTPTAHATSIRTKMAASTPPATAPHTTTAATMTRTPVRRAPVTPAPVTLAPVTPAPVTPAPAATEPAAPEKPQAVEAAATTPATPEKPLAAAPAIAHPPESASTGSTAPKDPPAQSSESFRSVVFSGTQAEERVYENGKLARRVPVAPRLPASNQTGE